MYELLIPVLAFVSVMAVGGAVISAHAARKHLIKARLGQGQQQLPESAQPGRKKLVGLLGSMGQAVSGGKTSRSLREDLARAGYHGSAAPAVYIGSKVVLLIGGILAVGAAAMPLEISPLQKVLWPVAVGALVSFIPNVAVRLRRARRGSEVRQHLADAVDLLEICVSSGMGMDQAWNAVTDEIRRVSTVLADEMALTNLEMHLGVGRATAMRHMAERTAAPELSSLVAMLVQSEKFGTSVADALRTFAQSLRELRSQRAQETAEKMAVKLLFPMVLFIFPALLIVMAGPAAIKLYSVFSRG